MTFNTFWIHLWYLVGRNFDIFLEDFNTDGFKEVKFWNQNLRVFEPNHLDGALLDHVYINKLFGNEKYVTSVGNNTNFSDHDAFKVQIRFRQNNQEDIDFNINKWTAEL